MDNKNLTLLQTLLDEVNSIQFGNFDEDKIRSKTKLYIKKCFGESSEYMERLEGIHFTPSIYYRNMPKSAYYDSFCKGKKYLLNLISTMIEDLELTIEEMDKNDADESPNQKQFKTNNIFIVHGHDQLVRNEVELFVKSIDYNPIILCKEPNLGQTIIEKIESNAENVCFAIVLYTACDEGKAKQDIELKPRARQNVLFEHGYMCSKLGRDHVVALLSDRVEQPGDLNGVVYVELDNGGAWQFKIANEMKAVGLNVDLNKIKL